MKYVSGPYFEPDFDPVLDRFGNPGYVPARPFRSFAVMNSSVLDDLGAPWLQGCRRQ
jgi:hypothetical protein